MRRFFSAVVLALLAVTAAAVPAQAHAELRSSNPASGAALDAPPPQVELTFSDVISLPDDAAVTITGPDGAKWPMTESAAVDRTITAKFDTTAMKAGAHTLAWKAKSEDGDVVEGTFSFTMNVAAPTSSPAAVTSSVPVTTTAARAAETGQGSGGSGWIWVWIALALVVAVGAVLLVRRRQA
ncbi:hypothetical protein SAMN05216553_103438 [Lentzea fradiae]|uniref:CopC domain-containing protein n=1 Tax=Lentzea fradiae TaxID=200378 RepID=A0A1G7P8W1_9PSEU|nr:copper resistance CopC family protein [Lentzea fradiae]SDF82029.1 hypothetical protein SAMN05216553_103438 [Lentzea fradiae]